MIQKISGPKTPIINPSSLLWMMGTLDCFKEHFTCFLVICIVCFFVSAIVLGAHGGLKFHDYLQEERHYVKTTCNLKSVDETELKDCTYYYTEECHHGSCRVNEWRDTRYRCVKAVVSYAWNNKSVVAAALFRSYQDAEKTDYECAAYECEHSDDILQFANDLEVMHTFQCYSHPGKPDHVYIDSGVVKSDWLIFFFVFELSLAAVFCIAVCACCICCCWERRQNTFQKRKIIDQKEKLKFPGL